MYGSFGHYLLVTINSFEIRRLSDCVELWLSVCRHRLQKWRDSPTGLVSKR